MNLAEQVIWTQALQKSSWIMYNLKMKLKLVINKTIKKHVDLLIM